MKYPEYLGDGVYVHLSNYGEVVLTTGHHEIEQAGNVVVLDVESLTKLTRWLEAAKEKFEAEKVLPPKGEA